MSGFQTSEKCEAEAKRYAELAARGVDVTTYGTGSRPAIDDNVAWVELAHNRWHLENQWYLLSTGPEPLVFVGYELSPDEIYAVGGIANPDKKFAGFVSDDPRVIGAVDAHLSSVGPDGASSEPSRGAA